MFIKSYITNIDYVLASKLYAKQNNASLTIFFKRYTILRNTYHSISSICCDYVLKQLHIVDKSLKLMHGNIQTRKKCHCSIGSVSKTQLNLYN